MAVRRKYDIPVIVALFLATVGYGASRTEYRLQPSMPREFFDSSVVPAAKRASELKIAAAYWDCAVRQIQWKYGYASRLPNEPPPEFSVSPTEFGAAAQDANTRSRYWLQVRKIWNMSSAWKTEHQWSSISFLQSLRSIGEWWGQVTRNIMHQ
jgi:hypothetical protein